MHCVSVWRGKEDKEMYEFAAHLQLQVHLCISSFIPLPFLSHVFFLSSNYFTDKIYVYTAHK